MILPPRKPLLFRVRDPVSDKIPRQVSHTATSLWLTLGKLSGHGALARSNDYDDVIFGPLSAGLGNFILVYCVSQSSSEL